MDKAGINLVDKETYYKRYFGTGLGGLGHTKYNVQSPYDNTFAAKFLYEEEVKKPKIKAEPPKTFSVEEVAEIKKIVEELVGLGAYLVGSRMMLPEYNYATTRDWDFNCRSKFEYGEEDTKLVSYVVENFTPQYGASPYETNRVRDNQAVQYYKHNKFPHITLYTRKDMKVFKAAWEALDRNLWYEFMWKSHPDKANETPEEVRIRQKITTQIFNSLYKAATPPEIDSWM